MASTAFQTVYREEFIASFERHQAILRDCTVTEAMVKGNVAVFLVAGSGGATAVTRGVSGLIPARSDDMTANSCTLAEWHDLVRKTDFNIFAAQSNEREIMQKSTMAVINRKIDQDIIDVLDTATVTTGSTYIAGSCNLLIHAKVILGVNEVRFDGQVFAAITPAFEGYLLQDDMFSNSDYVSRKPLDSDDISWKDSPGYYNWGGMKIVVQPGLTGAGTSSEKCYVWHRNALGHAADTAGMESAVGHNDEHAYSWARCSIHMGAKLLQSSGLVQVRHDGSGFAAV